MCGRKWHNMSQSILIDSKFMLYMRSKNSAKNRYWGRFESEVYIYDWTTISMPAKPKKNKQSMTSTNKYVLFPYVFVSQIK